MEMAL